MRGERVSRERAEGGDTREWESRGRGHGRMFRVIITTNEEGLAIRIWGLGSSYEGLGFLV
jgi:hypothetical protein